MPIKDKYLLKYLWESIIKIELSIAPPSEKKKLDTAPVTSAKIIVLNIAIKNPSLYPIATIVTSTTIFESPRRAPGIVTGRGITLSNNPSTIPSADKSAKKIIFWFFFILKSNPIH